jgi:hypothetical protein
LVAEKSVGDSRWVHLLVPHLLWVLWLHHLMLLAVLGISQLSHCRNYSHSFLAQMHLEIIGHSLLVIHVCCQVRP